MLITPYSIFINIKIRAIIIKHTGSEKHFAAVEECSTGGRKCVQRL